MSFEKLDQLTMNGNFQHKVETIMSTLVAKGYVDVWIAEAKRTRAQQADKVRKGYSKTLASNHVKRGTDKGSLAADIVPKSKGWRASKRFWLMFGWMCFKHGVGWGGLFGVSTLSRRQKIKDAMQRLSEAGWPDEHPDYQVQIGWDPAHCQVPNNWANVR